MGYRFECLVFLQLVCAVKLLSANRVPTCGYESCDLGKAGMTNVHIVSHTHDDVGWLKTVDQYFYGYKNSIQHAGVQYILDTSIRQLLEDDRRRFIYVEIAFFYRWWNQQSDLIKTKVRGLVNNGTLQFILGGWCMNDEAATHYAAVIDQHTLGLQFLRTEFGDCGRPRVAWQIDPFGHAREMAAMFAQMGYDAVYFWRADYQDVANRRAHGQLELIWRGSNNLPGTDLFTGILNGTYCPPPGFCFDSLCSDDPIMDDRRMHDYNVKKRVDDFLETIKYQAKYFTTNHIMIPMGCDFQYENAREWFLNLDKLIKYTNARQASGSKVNVIYSTPSCYTYAVNKAGFTYTSLKTDDFFPYADSPHSFWTGYFTSRAALKGMVRRISGQLQAVKQLAVFSRLPVATTQADIDTLRRALGVAQHHDAVSGTEKQAVAFDYAQRLSEGVTAALKSAGRSLQALKVATGGLLECPLINTSSCAFTRNNTAFRVLLYNPSSQPRSWWVRLPSNSALKIADSQGRALPSVTTVVSARTQAIPEGREERAHFDVLFRAALPALGSASFDVSASGARELSIPKAPAAGPLVISNGKVSLTFDTVTGLLTTFENVASKVQTALQVTLAYYTGYTGPHGRVSGAYVFRPNQTQPIGPTKAKLAVLNTPLVKEVHQTFLSWLTLVYRLYADANHVELEWTVGPIVDADAIGREVILRYQTPFKVDNCFTDSNGRQMLKRTINYRPTWKFQNTEPVSGNFYPIPTRILLRDETTARQFAVLTDRSEGGGCPRPGELEVMLHRRTMRDDSLGVGEPLNERGSDGKGLIVRGVHVLHIDSVAGSTDFHRQQSAIRFFRPLMLLGARVGKLPPPWTALRVPLPANVQLLTAENWEGGKVLLRFEHLYEAKEDSKLASPVTFDINVFNTFNVTNAEVMTLAANQQFSESARLRWKLPSGSANTAGSGVSLSGTKLTLQPMAIATLLVS